MSRDHTVRPDASQITRLLLDWRNGDAAAVDELMPVVYTELRRIAHQYMRRQSAGHSLQTTALVNEAFLKLIDSDRVNWQDRSHFFAICSQLMRRILVDSARRRQSQKRGGDRLQVTLEDEIAAVDERRADVIALDEALKRLAGLSPRQSQIVELRYFGGLTEEQVAETLDISARTVRRDWNVARAWLYRELRPDLEAK
jgi:RNA polymerase sigma-70 factor, ECF subfamily